VFKVPAESKKARKKFKNELNDEVKLPIWPYIRLQTTDDTLDHYLKEDVPSEQGIVCLYYVNETTWKHVRKSKF
jgi:hypothetical protein